jgi:hypothetical protein
LIFKGFLDEVLRRGLLGHGLQVTLKKPFASIGCPFITLSAESAVSITTEVNMVKTTKDNVQTLIGVLFHLKKDSDAYKVVLDQLLRHDDIRCPDDLCCAISAYCEDMTDRWNEFVDELDAHCKQN